MILLESILLLLEKLPWSLIISLIFPYLINNHWFLYFLQATAPNLEEKLGKLAPAHAVAGSIASYFVERLALYFLLIMVLMFCKMQFVDIWLIPISCVNSFYALGTYKLIPLLNGCIILVVT